MTNRRASIRLARPSDLEAVAHPAAALWPDASVAEHRDHAAAILDGKPPSPLPLVLFVAEVEAQVVGFVEVGVGRALMMAAADWSRSMGAFELASDTWIDEEPSQRAHAALGFEVVDRCIHFRKPL